MTFEQIQTDQKIYVNDYGVTFMVIPNTENMLVRYSIDSGVSIEVIKPIQSFYNVFLSPDKIDYNKLLAYSKL